MMRNLLFLLFFLPLSAGAELYSMEDLKALAEEGNYKEFFDHALDIRPSQRQEEWRVLVIKMGELLTKDTLSRPLPKKEEFQKVESLFSWSALKSDDVFRLRRQQIGIRYLKNCMKKKTPCWDEFKQFWEKDKNDPENAYRLAELIQDHPSPLVPLWGLLEVTFKSPLCEFYFEKIFALESLWGKIEIDYVRQGPQGDLLTKIDQTLHPDCIQKLTEEAHKRLKSPQRPIDRELSFGVLKALLKADQKTSDFFYTLYILDNPAKGELFNYSWNALNELGKHASRRDLVMKQIKLIDPLPDNLLTSMDETKKKAILRHMRDNFPEYFDYYALKCINYYSGKEKFPRGNPTLQCQDLMKSDLAPLVIDEFRIKKFQEVFKI